MITDKTVLHFISLAKYWLAFFKISFSIRNWRTEVDPIVWTRLLVESSDLSGHDMAREKGERQ
jgi:hypothetical protein